MPVAPPEAPGSRDDGKLVGAAGRPSEPRVPARSGSGSRAALQVVRIVHGEAPQEPSVVSIVSRPHDEVLEYTHAFVSAYVRRRFLSRVVEPLSVATYELLANALNYGSVSGEVLLQIHEGPTSLAVRVANETVQTRIDMLCAQLDRISKNAEATFVEEMKRSVGGGVGRPVLGLARVVHEAKLGLEVFIAAPRVTVIARTLT